MMLRCCSELSLTSTKSTTSVIDFTRDSKRLMSIRATRRILAPYVKARKKPKKEVQENKYFSYYVRRKPSILMKVMTKWCFTADLRDVMDETAQMLKEITNSAEATVYMVDETTDEIYKTRKSAELRECRISFKIETGATVAAHVAATKNSQKIRDLLEDVRFPKGVGNCDLTVQSVICVPVMTPEDECIAVFELYRYYDDSHYDDRDLNIVNTLSAWVGAAIYQNQQKMILQRKQELSEYLLDLTGCYFADAMLLNKLITEVVNSAKIALNAEFGKFYVLHKVYDDVIFADIYEEYVKNTRTFYKTHLNVKLDDPFDIVNIVARNGNTINVKNAFTDSRVTQKKKNYRMRSILCIPIKCVDQILGVMAMINKIKSPYFEKSDEILLQTFSDYCGSVLKYAREYDTKVKISSLNNVYLEMLESQMMPCIHDTNFVINHPEVPSLPERFHQFDYSIEDFYEIYMPQLVMYMINDISKNLFENVEILGKFALIVRQNYISNLSYHNFRHAFNVCHCIYNVIRRNKYLFTAVEVTALIISSICHDIGHFGRSNSFLLLTRHSLSELYEESQLENFHFHLTSVTFQILNLSSYMPVDEYKQFMSEVRMCILATDLSTHFAKRYKLEQLYLEDNFDLTNETHRFLFKSSIMTMADLSGLCKPFPAAKDLTDNLYTEYYNEGDIVKKIGFSPLSFIDRDLSEKIPADQYNFLTCVVLPCIKLVMKILPNCEPLYYGAEKVRDSWQEIRDSQRQKLWSFDGTFSYRKKTFV